MIAPLRMTIDVDCSSEHAFRTWTERFSAWWPDDHSVTGHPAVVVLEPRSGGRIYERTADGAEIDWGEVTTWDPPRRLGYLWHLRRDRRDATDVEINFMPTPTGCRVEIEHSGWERLGVEAEQWRDQNHGGWRTLIPHYVQMINSSQTN